MRALTLNTTYGVIVHRNFIPLHIDENYARIFGYDSAEHMLSNIDSLLDLIAPEDRIVAQKTNQDMLTGKVEATTGTRVNISVSGEPITVLTLDQVIEWQGEPALRVTVVDLTLLEKANQKIRDNEKQYRQLITQSKQGIMIHRNFKPLLVNDSWVQLYRGSSIQGVLDTGTIINLVPERFRELAMARNKEILESSIDGGRILVENICYDGSLRYFNLYDNRIIWDGEAAVQTVAEDVTDRVLLEKELAYKASHDQLTDLFNRDALFDWFERRRESIRSLSCLLIDIDNFKSINDNYGHYAGDKVIKAFAFLSESEVGNKGIVGRWGGEEFLILLPDLSTKEAIEVAESIRIAFQERVCRYGNLEIKATISIGVSTDCTPKTTQQFEQLLKQADENMYIAKHNGKNRVVY